MTDPKTLIDLETRVGSDAIVTDSDLCRTAGEDWRGVFSGPVLAVAQPKNITQVQEIIRWASETGTSLVPQSGNSSLAGGATPTSNAGAALILSARRLKKIRNFDAKQRLITVESGVILENLQQAVAPLEVPIDLGGRGSAQVGGLLACHAGGLNVVRYGSLRNHVRGMEVVWPNGKVWNGLKQVKKDNTGYDLKSLLIGSEGTLGFITAATLQLFPPANRRLTALIGITQPQEALELFWNLETDFPNQIYAAEMMTNVGMSRALEQNQQLRNPFEGRLPPFALLVEVGLREKIFEAETELFLDRLALHNAEVLVSQSDLQSENFWGLREGLVEAQRSYGPSVKHDVCVPMQALPALISQGMKICHETMPGCTPAPFGHLGDGSFHFNVSCPKGWTMEDMLRKSGTLTQRIHDLVNQLGGSISAEHGVGQARRAEVNRFRDPSATSIMRSIKKALDPKGLFNPGKLL